MGASAPGAPVPTTQSAAVTSNFSVLYVHTTRSPLPVELDLVALQALIGGIGAWLRAQQLRARASGQAAAHGVEDGRPTQ